VIRTFVTSIILPPARSFQATWSQARLLSGKAAVTADILDRLFLTISYQTC